MKKILIYISLIFINFSVFADDIKEFEIEGLSIGTSALNFFTK